MKKCLFCYEPLLENEIYEYHKTCSKKIFNSENNLIIPYTINEIQGLAKIVIERSIAIPGVQPKLSLSFENQLNKEKRLTIVGALGGDYILKPPTEDYNGMPENEHLTMLLANLFGIKTAQSSLIRLASNELAYIVKRMDRNKDGSKIHMLDMYQLTESYDKYKGTMERIGKTLDLFSVNPLFDKIRLFEITLFCFITGNADMHLKNFSMIENNDEWSLSACYDLLNTKILTPKDPEEMALLLDGKKSGFTNVSFIHFGENLGLNSKQIQTIFNNFSKQVEKGYQLISSSFLPDDQKETYVQLIKERFSRIY
jgi:serine/threonine-protein kinase HipA